MSTVLTVLTVLKKRNQKSLHKRRKIRAAAENWSPDLFLVLQTVIAREKFLSIFFLKKKILDFQYFFNISSKSGTKIVKSTKIQWKSQIKHSCHNIMLTTEKRVCSPILSFQPCFNKIINSLEISNLVLILGLSLFLKRFLQFSKCFSS